MKTALDKLIDRSGALKAKEYVFKQKMMRDIVMRADVVSIHRFLFRVSRNVPTPFTFSLHRSARLACPPRQRT
jgi:hypothetical protein